MEGGSQFSQDVLATYAADAARDVEGVRGLVDGPLHRHRGVKVTGDDRGVALELRLVLDWGASVPEVGRQVQERVAEYLARMADVRPRTVDVVVDEVGPPAASS